jgi:iron complex transport system permease protein
MAALLLYLTVLSLEVGAVDITYHQICRWMADVVMHRDADTADAIYRGVFFQIRFPRTLLCILVGATLSVSGTVMQSLFRNPIVEPGLVGTSAGAALGAGFVFVFGSIPFFDHSGLSGDILLPVFAFAGAWIATMIVYRISTSFGKVSVATMLLAGMSVNALATAGTGFLSYIARDPQARSITFWNLGTFSGADWRAVMIVGTSTITISLIILRYARQLNLLQLGDTEAAYLGVNTEKLKRRLIFLNTLMVATATAMVGVIVFIGLLVPHILRIIRGSDSRYMVIGSALLGGIVMLSADMVCRVIIAPAEMPIGIISAFVGAPLFIWILVLNQRRQNRNASAVFRQGEFVAVMGSNGAGKSTLLKMLTGILRPGSGRIIFKGKDISGYTTAELATERGVLSQSYQLTFPITVSELIMMGRYPYFDARPSMHDQQICDSIIDTLNIRILADRDYQTLSGGEAQKAQMARVLAQVWQDRADVSKALFLDEPVSSLDVKYQHEILNIAKCFSHAGNAVITVLHDINLALQYADRIYFMSGGEIKYTYQAGQALDLDMLQDIFDVQFEMTTTASGRQFLITGV